MSPSPRNSPIRVVLPHYMQPGAAAGSPPLQPLLPPPASPPSSGSTGSSATPTQTTVWQFGSVSRSSPLEDVREDAAMLAEGEGLGVLSDAAALRAELDALRSALARVEGLNAELRDQVRELERGRQRGHGRRASQVGRLRDMERELSGAQQEISNLKDALSLVEDERDDLGRRLREVERELRRAQQRILELNITVQGRTFESRMERGGRLNAERVLSRLREELGVARREASSEIRRLSEQVCSLLEELRCRVPRPLYDCVLDRARANDRRARGEESDGGDDADDLREEVPAPEMPEVEVGSAY
ncbi:hypothetical protein GGG16DRAFT_106797 [Schizophyllum commune]